MLPSLRRPGSKTRATVQMSKLLQWILLLCAGIGSVWILRSSTTVDTSSDSRGSSDEVAVESGGNAALARRLGATAAAGKQVRSGRLLVTARPIPARFELNRTLRRPVLMEGRPHLISPQQYARTSSDGAGHRRRLDASAFEPLRIKVETVSVSGISDASLRTWLTDTLIPSAIATLQSALSVQPVQGALLAERVCLSSYPSVADNTCATARAPTCGITDTAGNEQDVPASMLRALRLCTSCFSDASKSTCLVSAGSACSTLAQGTGVSDTDFVLYLSALSTSSCSGGTLAYASQCVRDQDDRPVLGYANFCPSALSMDAEDWDDQHSTAVHEILHALGFSEGSWALFRNDDGSPRTARDSDGLPPEVQTVCTDGSTQTVRAPSTGTVAVATDSNGIVTNTMVTPRVVSVAADTFGCPCLAGARLENQPTNSGCYGSHWEQRNYMHTLMASTATHHAALSVLTLAAMEDSGWYKSNYSMAEPLLWGRNAGCAFVTGECITGDTAADGFCHEKGEVGCTPDHRALGYCNLEDSLSIPTQFQHFTDSAKGGTSIVADYCPYVTAYSNGKCSTASNAPANDHRGQSYGAGSSMCFQTSLTTGTSSATTVGCYETRCHDDELQLKVVRSGGGHDWVSCPSPGAIVSPPNVAGFNGAVTCPPLSFELLCQPHACPGLPCDGLSTCNGGACTCGTAFGTSCGVASPPPDGSNCSSPPPPPAMPPAAPGGTYVSVVAFTLTASVDITAFDQGAFKTKLALHLDVPEGSIALTVSSGSVLVGVEITLADADQAASVAAVVRGSSAAQLSSALGVTITHVSSVTVTLRLQDPPSPPSSPPLLGALSLFIGIGAGMCALLIIGLWLRSCITRRINLWLWARQEKAARKGPSTPSPNKVARKGPSTPNATVAL